MLFIRALDLSIGRPTSDGKMYSGKLLPAKPHFTNFKYTSIKIRFFRFNLCQTISLTPVPLSQTTILLP